MSNTDTDNDYGTITVEIDLDDAGSPFVTIAQAIRNETGAGWRQLASGLTEAAGYCHYRYIEDRREDDR